MLERFDGHWRGASPWQKVVRKEIPNDSARVAQLQGRPGRHDRARAGGRRADAREGREAQDRQGRHASTSSTSSSTCATSLRRSSPRTARRCRRTRSRTRGCARPSTSPSTGRRSPRSSMEGLGRPVNPDGDPRHLRLQREAPRVAPERSARAPAPGRGRLPERLQGRLPLHQRPPARRPRRRHLGRADARPHRARGAGERRSRRRCCSRPARAATTPS